MPASLRTPSLPPSPPAPRDAQARALEHHTSVPVLHAGSVLPVLDPALSREDLGGGCITPTAGYVRRVAKLGYDMTWVRPPHSPPRPSRLHPISAASPPFCRWI